MRAKYFTSDHFELDDDGQIALPGPWLFGSPELEPDGKCTILQTRSNGHRQTTRPAIDDLCFSKDSTVAQREVDRITNHGFSLRILAPLPDAEAQPPSPQPSTVSYDDALKMSVLLIPSDPAADLDGDGEVTAADARLIRAAEAKERR